MTGFNTETTTKIHPLPTLSFLSVFWAEVCGGGGCLFWFWGFFDSEEGKEIVSSLLNQPGRQETHTSSFRARPFFVSRTQPSSKSVLKQRHKVLASQPFPHSTARAPRGDSAQQMTAHHVSSLLSALPAHSTQGSKCFRTASKRRIRSFLSHECLD